MNDLGVLTLRGVAGGTLVVAFALLGEVVQPKAFSGLFSAAPSVALASLTMTVMIEQKTRAYQQSVGMAVGAVAMAVCCVVAVVAVPRLGAAVGSAAAWVAWIVIALALYWDVFIGAH